MTLKNRSPVASEDGGGRVVVLVAREGAVVGLGAGARFRVYEFRQLLGRALTGENVVVKPFVRMFSGLVRRTGWIV